MQDGRLKRNFIEDLVGWVLADSKVVESDICKRTYVSKGTGGKH